MATKKNPLDAFGKAKTAPTTAKKSSSHKEASVTDDIKAAVDKLVIAKAAIKSAEADQADAENLIIGHVKPQIDQLGYSGEFTKSIIVPGVTASVMYTQADRFSVPQDPEEIETVRELTGDEFEDMFEVKTVLQVKPAIISDEEKLGALVKACEKAGIDVSDYFERIEKLTAKDDLDQKQYKLPAGKLAEFRMHVKPNKPALKPRG